MSAASFEDAWAMTTTRAKVASDGARPTAESGALDFDVVYREHRVAMAAVVRSVIGPSDELEDVLQHVFIEVHRALPRFEGRSRLSTWLYRIAVNVAIQHVRKRKRRRWLVLGGPAAADGHEAGRRALVADDRGRVEDRQMLERIHESVARLTEKKRVVWQLHELQGLEPVEIAEILDIPMNTVRSRLLAARKDLMDDLAARGVLDEAGDP